jgi:superfamily II DNA or RNA helicase
MAGRSALSTLPFAGRLEAVAPMYDLPQDNIVDDVFVPALEVADDVAIASGYFSSEALAKIAPGLASALSAQAQFRVLLSPHLSDEDWSALDRGVRSPEAVVADAISRLLSEGNITPSALQQHAADCLSYLVATGRLEFRFVLMPLGMYHKKQWLIKSGDATVAVHGSGNATVGGLFVNGEQMSVDRDWADGDRAARKVDMLRGQFERDWAGQRPNCITITASAAVELLLDQSRADGGGVTVEDFWRAWRQDFLCGREPPLPVAIHAAPTRLAVPGSLQWREGRYSHQRKAVDAFLENGERGVLAIATGGGKTKTALIAATQIQDLRPDQPFLLVILVPSDPLVRQWAEEVRGFGVTPTLLGDIPASTRAGRLAEIEAAFIAGSERTTVIVATRQLFASDAEFRELVERCSTRGETMLVGDEAHNFGVRTFIDNPPTAFRARLGLSATPVRQYDLAGTNALFDFFGPQIFEFTLGEAIDAGCLVPYDYFIHRVELTLDEMERYRDLTYELNRAGFHMEDDGRVVITNPKIERLLRRRRAVLEQAEGKIGVLRDALIHGPVTRTLIYCSPKELEVATEKQIVLVNRLLSELGIISHELTSRETAAGRGSEILRRFAEGQYQALTAMKVLDEGVDVPATESAFILASTTVEREWVQRRGRVLRTAPGKTSAAVHDFVVIPPAIDDAGKAVLRGEIRRLRAFAELARNRWAIDGPVDEIELLEQLARG